MDMKLEELGFDDEDLLGEDGVVNTGEPDDDIKRWIEGDTPDVIDTPDPEGNTGPVTGTTDNEPEDDLIASMLKAKGINPEAIKFQKEDGEIEEIPFSELSREEQLDLLNYNDSEENYGLEPEEISLINELRTNNLSVEDYLEAHRRQAIQDYLDGLEDTPEYQVDSMSDDELFLADLKANVPELTDEEALEQLNLEKQNEALFNKKMSGMRATYQQREQAMAEQQQAEYEAQQQEAAEAFEATILEAIQDNETIDLGESSLTMSEDDMNEIASFILDSDAAGVRHIAKALNDPQMLVQMSWFALKGQEAMRQITEYYKHQISEVSKENYKKGFADAKAGKASNPAKTVVKRPDKGQSKQTSIYDLD